MKKIRKGDEIIVITGKDKGKRGTVQEVLPDTLVVEGVNRVRKSTKPNPMKGIVGGFIDKEMPIHCSNVALFHPDLKKASRVGIKQLEDGRSVRYYKSNGEVIDS